MPRGALQHIINALSAVIPTKHQDPTPLADLARRLIRGHDGLHFSHVLRFDPPVDFIQGLRAPLPSINLLVLDLLLKSTPGSDYVASNPELSLELVRLWLSTPESAVATRCRELLDSLLALEESLNLYSTCRHDHPPPNVDESTGPGALMWRRLTMDPSIYNFIISACNARARNAAGDAKKKSTAQARLLEFLTKAIGSHYVWAPIQRERATQNEAGQRGLIHFAAIEMADYDQDDLLRYMRVTFFTKWLSRTPLCYACARNARAFVFLRESGLHDQTIRDFLDEGLSWSIMNLSGYIQAFGTRQPVQFLQQTPNTRQQIFKRVLGLCSRMKTYRDAGATNLWELSFLSSLPRGFLYDAESLVTVTQHVGARAARPETLHALSRLFRGLDGPAEGSGQSPHLPDDVAAAERAAARVHYLLYFAANPSLWVELLANALTSEPPLMMATMNFLRRFLLAQWEVPSYPSPDQPTPAQLLRHCGRAVPRVWNWRDLPPGQSPLPATPFDAICDDSALGEVLAILLQSRREVRLPMDNDVTEVARAYMGAVRAFHARLSEARRSGQALPPALDQKVVDEVEALVRKGERLGLGVENSTKLMLPERTNGTH